MSAIIPRATVDQIVAQRNKALALYEDAWDKLETAYEACQEANRAARISAAGAGFDGYNRHVSADDRGQFMDILKLPKRETFLADVRRITDTDVWSHIIRTTELERLMDKQAKDQQKDHVANQMFQTAVHEHRPQHTPGLYVRKAQGVARGERAIADVLELGAPGVPHGVVRVHGVDHEIRMQRGKEFRIRFDQRHFPFWPLRLHQRQALHVVMAISVIA